MKMETMKKTIIFDKEMIEKIEQMAKDAERDFSGQVRFIIKEYIKMKETNWDFKVWNAPLTNCDILETGGGLYD